MPSMRQPTESGAGEAPGIIGPTDGMRVPRYAGLSTFARLPRLEDAGEHDVAVVGVPFDAGVTYRPGARFGPAHIRQASRLLRPYHPGLEVQPFAAQQVVDAGDLPCNPFDIPVAVKEVELGARELVGNGRRLLTLGGDHTIAYPLLRTMNAVYGPVALVHFDAHLDTWDTYFDAPLTHGTPFRRAAEEGLFQPGRSAHVGVRGSLYDPKDLDDDADMGFSIVHCAELDRVGVHGVGERLHDLIGDAPLYVSVDIDVLDPAHAPATGTPEAGGMTSRELLGILRRLARHNLVGADIVEVAPAYDHAEITGIAAAHLAYELVSLFARGRQ